MHSLSQLRCLFSRNRALSALFCIPISCFYIHALFRSLSPSLSQSRCLFSLAITLSLFSLVYPFSASTIGIRKSWCFACMISCCRRSFSRRTTSICSSTSVPVSHVLHIIHNIIYYMYYIYAVWIDSHILNMSNFGRLKKNILALHTRLHLCASLCVCVCVCVCTITFILYQYFRI